MALDCRVVVPEATKPLTRRASWAILPTTLAVLLAACGPVSVVAPQVVTVASARCGAASHTTGLGVIVGDGLVLTAAHVVVAAGGVEVTPAVKRVSNGAQTELQTNAQPSIPGEIVVLDTARDLALIHAPGLAAEPLTLGDAQAGDSLVALLPDGKEVVLSVLRRIRIDIDDVRASTRSKRDGYEMRGDLGSGDSGAGIFDLEGRLVAVFFSRSVVRDVVFAIGAFEVNTVLSAPRSRFECDPAESRVVSVPN